MIETADRPNADDVREISTTTDYPDDDDIAQATIVPRGSRAGNRSTQENEVPAVLGRGRSGGLTATS